MILLSQMSNSSIKCDFNPLYLYYNTIIIIWCPFLIKSSVIIIFIVIEPNCQIVLDLIQCNPIKKQYCSKVPMFLYSF